MNNVANFLNKHLYKFVRGSDRKKNTVHISEYKWEIKQLKSHATGVT